MERRPSAWADAQRDFRGRYDGERETLARRRIHWRATAPSAVPAAFGIGIAGLVRVAIAAARVARRVSSGDTLNSSPFISLWPVDAAAGTRAMLIFEITSMPDPAEGEGTVVGECELNGALCLVLDDGRLLWPTYNPRQPAFNAQRR